MKIKDKINFYWFSGAGNTLLVIKKMKGIFEKNGIEVSLHHIEKTNPIEVDLNNTIGLAFPVAFQGTYPFVWEFVKSLPKSNGSPIFAVDTLEMFSGGVIGPLKKILKNKRYQTIGAKEIKMPSNLLPKKINKEKNKKIIQNALKKAEEYTYDLLEGKSKWRRIPILSDLVSLFSRSEKLWKFFRKFYKLKVDENKCTQCELCSKICPVENIKMDGYPIHGEKCYFCMRCISFCPTEAIYITKIKSFQRYRALKVDELIDKELLQ